MRVSVAMEEQPAVHKAQRIVGRLFLFPQTDLFECRILAQVPHFFFFFACIRFFAQFNINRSRVCVYVSEYEPLERTICPLTPPKSERREMIVLE